MLGLGVLIGEVLAVVTGGFVEFDWAVLSGVVVAVV